MGKLTLVEILYLRKLSEVGAPGMGVRATALVLRTCRYYSSVKYMGKGGAILSFYLNFRL